MSNYMSKPTLAKPMNRIAAFILDTVLFLILFTGVLYLISLIFGFDALHDTLRAEQIKEGYLILNAETNEYEIISKDHPNYDVVIENVSNNALLMDTLFTVNQFSMNAPLIALAIVMFILEFVVPMFLKNGQTVGMKFFKIALISNNNLAITTTQLFARCIIGKIAVLGIIPMLAILYIFLNAGGGLFGTIILLVVVIIQIIMLIKNKNHEGIADKIANVYPVNFTETVIYKTQKELDEAYYNYNK